MSEFDDQSPAASPENALRARVKLQRVVFGALAAVLVALGAMGLTAYREMQGSMQLARTAEVEARQDHAAEKDRGDRLDRLLHAEQAHRKQISGALGLAQCRLAVAEARAGRLARGRELLQESRQAGAPAWWPLAATLLRDPAARFAGGVEAERPVTAGAVSGDGRRVLVARTSAEGASVLVLYSALGGEPLARVRLPDAPGLPSPVADTMHLDRGGLGAVVAAPGRLFFVEFRAEEPRVTELIAPHAPDQHPGGRLRALAADPDCRQLHLVRKGSLTRMDRGAQGQAWSEAPIPTDLPEADLHAFVSWSGGSALADSDRLLLSRGGRYAVAHRFSLVPAQVRLAAGPGVVWAAARDDRRIELATVPLAGGEVAVAVFELATPPDEWFGFLADGALVCGAGGGRAFELTPSGRHEITLGGGALTFAARHECGMLFGTTRGELSLRPLDDVLQGFPLAAGPTGAGVDALPGGFVAAMEGQIWVLPEGGGSWFAAEGADTVFPQPQGFVASNGSQVWFQNGMRMPLVGRLLGAARDGTLLLRVPDGLLVRQGNLEQTLSAPCDGPPDECVFAARAAACALRWNDQVFVCDLRQPPRLVASRTDAAIDRVALDAEGRTLAVLAGTTVRVVPLAEATGGQSVVTRSAPRAIALLFGGTVLAAAEGSGLVLYEVQDSRELWRTGARVLDLAGIGDETLLLAAGSLGVLRLGE
ncbi:MAG: hypothetical protein IT463_04010 [Planctomycetes bacterium]|nr:hypothetical protein [Planctomycetota bacterium]